MGGDDRLLAVPGCTWLYLARPLVPGTETPVVLCIFPLERGAVSPTRDEEMSREMIGFPAQDHRGGGTCCTSLASVVSTEKRAIRGVCARATRSPKKKKKKKKVPSGLHTPYYSSRVRAWRVFFCGGQASQHVRRQRLPPRGFDRVVRPLGVCFWVILVWFLWFFSFISLYFLFFFFLFFSSVVPFYSVPLSPSPPECTE